MKVPEGKTIYIGKRKYRAGEELPAFYKVPEKKTAQKPAIQQDNK